MNSLARHGAQPCYASYLMHRCFVGYLICGLLLSFGLGHGQTTSAAKPKVTKLDDLPRYTYPVQGSAVDLVTSDAKFSAFAVKVRANIEKNLQDYDIADKTTLKRLKSTLLTLDLLENKTDDARKLISELRALEDKPALKIMTGFVTETRLDVSAKTGMTNLADLNKPAFQKAFETELAARTDKLPWKVVQDELKSTKGGFELVSRNLVLGRIESEIQPVVDKTHALSSDLAEAIVHARSSLELSIPLQKPIVAAMTTVIDKHQVAKADIWNARAVTLAPDEKLAPLVVGIWDSGVDPKVYGDRLFNDPDYPKDGAEPHGLAFNLHSEREHGELYPLGDHAGEIPGVSDADQRSAGR